MNIFSFRTKSAAKHSAKQQVSGSTQPTPSTSTPPPRTSSRNAKSMYLTQPDMYTVNDLNNFSFGAAPSAASASSSRLVDPLDTDDSTPTYPDTTPRPSLVDNRQNPRSHASQSPRSRYPHQQRQHRSANPSSSTSSLSRPSEAPSRSISRSGTTSATTLTSDEEMDGRHPLPPSRPRRAGNTSSEYLSDDDYDAYLEDSDHDPDNGIDIDSVVHEDSDRGTFAYPNPSRDSIPYDYVDRRRGSLAMAIPGSSSFENRIRDTRRPSKSLEDFHSFSFAQGSSSPASSRPFDDRPLPPAPTSVPQSEGDWLNLRKRSIQREKELPPLSSASNSAAGPSNYRSKSDSSAPPTSASAMDGLDMSWMQLGTNGLVDFDLSEVADVVTDTGAAGRRPSNYIDWRRGSAASTSTRRQSTISSSTDDIIHKRIFGVWASKKYRVQRQRWRFIREKDRQDDDPPPHLSHAHERERPSISNFFGSRPSTATDSHLLPGFFEPKERHVRDKEKSGKEKDKGKAKEAKEHWKGMSLDAEEVWINGAVGRFKVIRRNTPTPEASKPPQQRLQISYIRTDLVHPTTREAMDGPGVTIHKHSKAGAFSISRHYHQKSMASQDGKSSTIRNTTTTSTGYLSSKDSADGGRKRSHMILLATRRVQKAYTSTNTTRKLESHGLLDDTRNRRSSSRDAERARREHDRQRKERRDRDRDRDNREQERDRRRPAERTRPQPASAMEQAEVPSTEQQPPDSSEGSSAGSVVNALSSGDSGTLINPSTTPTTPDASEGTGSMDSQGSVEQSILSHETASSDRTINQNRTVALRSPTRRRDTQEDIEEDDDDNDSFEQRRRKHATSHQETYAVLPPEVFESAQQEHPSHGLFPWSRHRNTHRADVASKPYFIASYKPLWPVTAPRFNSETRKGIVDDLNMSFQDVGLLPAVGEIKGSNNSGHQKRGSKRDARPPVASSSRQVKMPAENRSLDIFETVPPDALYMILPLWPGETDSTSSKKYPFPHPTLPASARQYLLLWYRAILSPNANQDDHVSSSNGKTKSGEKKRSRGSRGSQTSSHESQHKREERGVLLSNFHITGRIVSYRELQGSGVRIPDAGLAISGPLEEAYAQMPPSPALAGDYVLGMCPSHDAGVEFYPEGFEKMGLARQIPNPDPTIDLGDGDDDSQSLDTISVLSPLGRAVMEMAWLGMLAVTSFNPNASS